MKDTFEKFVQDFITEVIAGMGFDNFTESEEDDLRRLIGNRVDKKIMGVILENLPEDKFKKLTKRLGEKNWTEEEQMTVFTDAAREIPDFETKLAEAFFALKKELLEDADELRNLGRV